MNSGPIVYIEYRKDYFSDHVSHVSNENGLRSCHVSPEPASSKPEHVSDLNVHEIPETFTYHGPALLHDNSSHAQPEFVFYDQEDPANVFHKNYVFRH